MDQSCVTYIKFNAWYVPFLCCSFFLQSFCLLLFVCVFEKVCDCALSSICNDNEMCWVTVPVCSAHISQLGQHSKVSQRPHLFDITRHTMLCLVQSLVFFCMLCLQICTIFKIYRQGFDTVKRLAKKSRRCKKDLF